MGNVFSANGRMENVPDTENNNLSLSALFEVHLN